MPALADALVENGSIILAVATAIRDQKYYKESIRGILYYALPMPRGNISGARLPRTLIDEYQRVVADFRPDVIHIHGTEYFEGLLTGRHYLDCPTVISIQGLISACQKRYWGDIPFYKLLTTRTLRDWARLDGLIEQRIKWIRRSKWEQEVFASNQAFCGRTLWDRAYTRRLNPEAMYYHCDELLREPFYDAEWDVSKMNRYTIFASGANYPLKGFHVLIKAVAQLVSEFPDVVVRTPLAKFGRRQGGVRQFWARQRSSGYACYLSGLIRRYGLEGKFVTFPSLDARQMAQELRSAHVFALPSLIENSPNSLAEAMLVGTPSIASYVGGVPSMAQDNESALFFPSGDENVLAEQIRRIFLDDQLTNRLSVQARSVASARHSKKRIVSSILEVYKSESRRKHAVVGAKEL